MTGQEWQEYMRKKHPGGKHGPSQISTRCRNEMKLMLQLMKLNFVQEHRFHPTRKWRFDFAIPEHMVVIEYEGLIAEKSRHTTIDGFTGDCNKYNAAVLMGWRVLRYTARNYTQMAGDLLTLIKKEQ